MSTDNIFIFIVNTIASAIVGPVSYSWQLVNLAEGGIQRSNGWKLKLYEVRLGSSYTVLTVRAINHYNKLPRGSMDSLSLDVFKSSHSLFLEA